MANGNGDRIPTLPIVLTILGLLITIASGSLAFHGRVMTDVHQIITTELKHIVTREELADLRRLASEQANQRHLAVMRRLDRIEAQLEQLKGKR